MKIEIKGNEVIVVREPEDKKIYSESRFFYLVARKLKEQGQDVVKKLMWKDGHLVDSNRYYIRERNWKYAIFDSCHALRLVYENYNKLNIARLTIETMNNVYKAYDF